MSYGCYSLLRQLYRITDIADKAYVTPFYIKLDDQDKAV